MRYAFPFLLCGLFSAVPAITGCERTVSQEKTTVRGSDGSTMKQTEKKVTQSPGGTVKETTKERVGDP